MSSKKKQRDEEDQPDTPILMGKVLRVGEATFEQLSSGRTFLLYDVLQTLDEEPRPVYCLLETGVVFPMQYAVHEDELEDGWEVRT